MTRTLKIDENLIKDVAKKYDLNVKCERYMSIYIVMLDDKEICYYSTLRAGWVQVSTQVTVDWCISDKPTILFCDKQPMRNEKEFLTTIQYLVLTYNKLKIVVSQIQKEVKIETKLNDLEKDFKND